VQAFYTTTFLGVSILWFFSGRVAVNKQLFLRFLPLPSSLLVMLPFALAVGVEQLVLIEISSSPADLTSTHWKKLLTSARVIATGNAETTVSSFKHRSLVRSL
jgi:hypothetical protein